MTNAHRFVEQLDQLVRSLASRPDDHEAQMEMLEQMRTTVAAGEVTVVATPGGLLVNGAPHAGPASTARGLHGYLTADGVHQLQVARAADAADLLMAARVLAERAGLCRLTMPTVRASAPLASRLTPVGVPAIAVGGTPAPAGRGEGLGPATVGAYAPPRLPTPTSGDLVRRRSSVETSAPLLNRGDSLSQPAILVRPTPTAVDRVLTTPELGARIAETDLLDVANRLLEELLMRLDRVSRAGDASGVREVLVAIADGAERTTVQEVHLAASIAFRRAATPTHLRLAAGLLPRDPAGREALLAALRFAGDDGADAIIEQLATADSASDRRAYYNALVALPAREAVLVHLLGDPRWYMVRNAADLIGELRLHGADDALVRALGHADDRVRRSVVVALGRLGTPAACDALGDLLATPEPSLRGAAAIALAAAGGPGAGLALRHALGEERDTEVRRALLTALGRVADDEGVDALARWAAPSRGLFRRNSLGERLAAVQALGAAGTPRSRAALGRLAQDRNATVAAAARREMAREGAK